MDEKQLSLVEEGLNLLIKRFKRNLSEGDLERMKIAQDAKVAIRKVILSLAVKGDIKDIVPLIDQGKGAGWEVTDFDDKVVRYHS